MHHRDVEFLSSAVLEDAVARTPYSYHVVWTGRPAVLRSGSLRSKALECVTAIGVPMRLRELMQRAARLDGQVGLHPDLVRAAVRLHQAAKPAVYLLVDRVCTGDFVAVTDIPFAGSFDRRIAEGEIVIGRDGSSRVEVLAQVA